MKKQGLNKRDHATMLEFIKSGVAMTKISDWLQVDKKYVKKYRDEYLERNPPLADNPEDNVEGIDDVGSPDDDAPVGATVLDIGD